MTIKKITRILTAIFLASIFCLSFANAAMKIIYVVHGSADDPFWGIVKNAVNQADKDFRRAPDRARVYFRSPSTYDMVEMARLIDQAVAEKPDGLAVSIPDANALGPSIRRAVRSGIPVVSLNSGSDVFRELGVSVHVGQTEYEAGLGGGTRMKSLGAKKAIILNHEVGNVALDLRAEGFTKNFGDAEVIAVSKDPSEIKSIVTARLRRDSSIDAVFALGPLSGEPALTAVESLGKVNSIKVASFDLSPRLLSAVKNGKVSFLIDQQPYLQGYLPAVFLVQLKRYATIPSGVVLTGPGFVTPKNADKVINLSKKGYR